MYSSFAVANAFIERALDGLLRDLNAMKLQKLMYFSQAWHLKVKGTPVIDDTFTRGENGPVLPSIHHQVKAYGSRPVTQTIRILYGDDDREIWRVPGMQPYDKSRWDLIDMIGRRYGSLTPKALSDLTHLPGSAWSQGGAIGDVLLNDVIRADPTL